MIKILYWNHLCLLTAISSISSFRGTPYVSLANYVIKGPIIHSPIIIIYGFIFILSATGKVYGDKKDPIRPFFN